MQQNVTEVLKPIGGYMELQLPQKEEYYPSLIKLNTGRNSWEYILRTKGYRHVFLPYFTCDAMLEPIQNLGITHTFYHIDKNLDPIIDFVIGEKDCFVYTNYFGLKQRTASTLTTKIKNIVIDNSQAFFSPPIPETDTFYSCRKFFGVPDGAYLQTTSTERLSLKRDVSINRFSHLIKSIDLGIEEGFYDYVQNNIDFNYKSVKQMSALSQKILAAIDYEECRKRRNANFSFLNPILKEYNELDLDFLKNDAPQVYPLLLSNGESLKKQLIQKKVYVPTFWPNVSQWTSNSMFENYLTNNLLPLPIDHRYTEDDMDRMLNILKPLL